jgi:hypothetical protein
MTAMRASGNGSATAKLSRKPVMVNRSLTGGFWLFGGLAVVPSAPADRTR